MTVEKKLKKRLTMRTYQETIVSDVVSNFNIGKPYVLGSCPSSGKTEMAIETIIRLMNLGLINKTLILAHSTNVLKKNFYNRLIEYFHEGNMITIKNGERGYNKDAKIHVMIPQNIRHIEGQFDLVIVDEAHHNVLAEDGNYSRIIEEVNPKFQLLLTGTPSKFILVNNQSEDQTNLPYHINCVGMDMVGFEHFHDVMFDLVRSAYSFNLDDYNQTENIAEGTEFSFEETERTVLNVIIGAVRNIAKRHGYDIPLDKDVVKEGKRLIKEGLFGKTLIMCRNIQQADQIAQVIKNLFDAKIEVSHSENDNNSIELDNFKAGKFDFLCVVNRAREGYDDKKVVNLIDITMTHNIDLIYQMFCRVVRKDDTNEKPKLYIKVTSNAEDMPAYTMNIMTAALMLSNTENLSRFNGRNFRGIAIPQINTGGERDINDPVVDGFIDVVDGDNNVVRRRRLSDLMTLDLVQMFDTDEELLIAGNERYAMTTLGDALDILNGIVDISKEQYFELLKKENIKGTIIWRNNYKELSTKNNLKYHSTPWILFNQSASDFFDECYPEDIIISDKETYFKIFRENTIVGYTTWYKRNKEICEKYKLKLHTNPWVFFKQSQKEFFDECYPKRKLLSDKNAYFKICVDNNITSNNEYRKRYKSVGEELDINLHSTPWTIFKQSQKEFFSECFPDRIICDDINKYYEAFFNNDIKSLHDWVDNYESIGKINNLRFSSSPHKRFSKTYGEFFNEYREWLKTNQALLKNSKPLFSSEFSKMNKSWNTSTSKTLHDKINANPQEWHTYHKLYAKARKNWAEIPYIEIAKKLKERPDWIVGDFGCGENLLSKEIKNKVYAFDHYAIDESVIKCDMSNIPLENNILDVAVFSLSLMSKNYEDYLIEAYRLLKPMGLLMIAEPADKWVKKEEDEEQKDLKKIVEDLGFKINGEPIYTDKFIYINAIKN